MRRLFIIGFLSILTAIGLLTPVSANVNNFTISNYDISMQLGIDKEGHSTLTTTETITAEFPNFDQNRGLERAIPRTYSNHSTGLDVKSVVDENGKSREYSTYSDNNDNLVVRMADMDVYVHGKQTYKLTYTQRDVTNFFENTNSDEFYWDTNGTDWRVPITQLNVVLEIDDSLRSKLTDKSACYFGTSGSSEQCQLTYDGTKHTTTASNLQPGQNVTVAVGFEPETFTPYQETLIEKLTRWWVVAQAILSPILLGVLIWIIVLFYRITNRSKEVKPIAPEYLPPKEYSVTTASQIKSTTYGPTMSAQLLDFAVRHFIKIYETSKKSLFKPAEYEIEIIQDLTPLKDEEKEILSDMFGKLPSVGERLNLKTLQNNMAFYRRTTDNDKKVRELIRNKYNLRQQNSSLKSRLRKSSLVLLILGLLTLSPMALFAALVTFGMSFGSWTLTDAGLQLVRYLKGLKMYINTAETERIKMLQSPEGANKTEVMLNNNEPAKLIKLYEKVLPYAVLFGQEKNWTKELGHYYEQAGSQPDWYTGQAAFSAATFASSMNNLSQTTSYASSSSSSSGGSSSGGFSGGGGGGGGGGGI